MTLHILKLCVGCDTVEDLRAWREEARARGEPWILRTRQTPKLATQVLDGGCLYRVFRGLILSRQRILAIETIGEGVERRCQMRLDEEIVLTVPTPRRAFQGWRYLQPEDAPPDLASAGVAESVPPEFAARLREAGVW